VDISFLMTACHMEPPCWRRLSVRDGSAVRGRARLPRRRPARGHSAHDGKMNIHMCRIRAACHSTFDGYQGGRTRVSWLCGAVSKVHTASFVLAARRLKPLDTSTPARIPRFPFGSGENFNCWHEKDAALGGGPTRLETSDHDRACQSAAARPRSPIARPPAQETTVRQARLRRLAGLRMTGRLRHNSSRAARESERRQHQLRPTRVEQSLPPTNHWASTLGPPSWPSLVRHDQARACGPTGYARPPVRAQCAWRTSGRARPTW